MVPFFIWCCTVIHIYADVQRPLCTVLRPKAYDTYHSKQLITPNKSHWTHKQLWCSLNIKQTITSSIKVWILSIWTMTFGLCEMNHVIYHESNYSWVPLSHGPIYCDITYSIAMTAAECRLTSNSQQTHHSSPSPDQATSYYLNQWWLDYLCICASLSLNELRIQFCRTNTMLLCPTIMLSIFSKILMISNPF